jgi:hypothetical protein
MTTGVEQSASRSPAGAGTGVGAPAPFAVGHADPEYRARIREACVR